MNPENQDFENLRRLLKLKRYEQPPPRYFSDFSGQVINRIQDHRSANQTESSVSGDLGVSWWQRLLSVLDAKPLLAGAFGAVVVGVLIGGAVSSNEVEISGGSSNLALSQVPLPAAATPVSVPVVVGLDGAFALTGSSSNAGNIFDKIGTPSVLPVNHTLFGR